MRITGLHLLLTYKCLFECDHCFVRSGPGRQGVMSLEMINNVLDQARDAETVRSIYFEGGEPFLYYPVLVEGVKAAAARGLEVGVVTNAYWATGPADARLWLQPLAGLLVDLTVSSDVYHSGAKPDPRPDFAAQAAAGLNIPCTRISVAEPGPAPEAGEKATLMFRGRAAEKLAPQAPRFPADRFRECPHEDLRDPGRVHLDPFGHVFICQGISIGNIFRRPLNLILRDYDPDRHPAAGPLLRGGPRELALSHDLPVDGRYADACHLCHETRKALAGRFPDIFTPAQLYGIIDDTD
ncbi:MAG: radical SAM protein [Pseudomonadota bacterium]